MPPHVATRSIPTPGERVLAPFFDGWPGREIFPQMFRCYVLDNYNFTKPEDRAYRRESVGRVDQHISAGLS
jgi:hypothetical protein